MLFTWRLMRVSRGLASLARSRVSPISNRTRRRSLGRVRNWRMPSSTASTIRLDVLPGTIFLTARLILSGSEVNSCRVRMRESYATTEASPLLPRISGPIMLPICETLGRIASTFALA